MSAIHEHGDVAARPARTPARPPLRLSSRITTCLAPITGHTTGNRLAARARTRGRVATPVPQVLFVDHHDTGPAQMAAGLLDHYAGAAVVPRSAGIDPGSVVDPFAVETLAQHGVEPVGLAPKPVTDELVRAADWVITLGAPPLGNSLLDAVPAHAVRQDWAIDGPVDESRGPSLVADLDSRIQALWVEITASPAALRR